MDLVLIRRHQDKQTIGSLFVLNTDFTAETLELPWKQNQSNISCIPEGKYKWERLENSPSFDYPHIWIKGVPDRSYIKIHRGNFKWQIKGCILVGSGYKDLDGDGLVDVINSKATLKRLMDKAGDSGTITIISQV